MLLLHNTPDAAQNEPLRIWARSIEERRGKRIAAVALARRIAGILWAMWRDGTALRARGRRRRERRRKGSRSPDNAVSGCGVGARIEEGEHPPSEG
jgi:hypothetical protein